VLVILMMTDDSLEVDFDMHSVASLKHCSDTSFSFASAAEAPKHAQTEMAEMALRTEHFDLNMKTPKGLWSKEFYLANLAHT